MLFTTVRSQEHLQRRRKWLENWEHQAGAEATTPSGGCRTHVDPGFMLVLRTPDLPNLHPSQFQPQVWSVSAQHPVTTLPLNLHTYLDGLRATTLFQTKHFVLLEVINIMEKDRKNEEARTLLSQEGKWGGFLRNSLKGAHAFRQEERGIGIGTRFQHQKTPGEGKDFEVREGRCQMWIRGQFSHNKFYES